MFVETLDLIMHSNFQSYISLYSRIFNLHSILHRVMVLFVTLFILSTNEGSQVITSRLEKIAQTIKPANL